VLARSQLDAALAAARQIEDRWVTAFALHFLAQSAANTGEVALASSLLQECIGMLEQLGGNKGGTAFSLLHLGRLARQHGDLAMARNRVRDALRLFAELDDRRGIAYALVGLAGVSLAAGDGRAAAYLFGASDTLQAAGGPFLDSALRAEVDRDLAAVHAALGDDDFTAVWRAGRSAPLDQTIAVALESAIDEALAVAGPLASQWTGVHGGGLARLSPREREVAALVAEGRSNGEIGAALVIAARTADTHVGHILSKLGLHKRAQIAVWVVEHSLGNLRAK
jgi:non-specific serine/threonine protein kinase